MSFLWVLAIQIVAAIVWHLLAPKPKVKTSPGDFRPPEPREGEPIPVVFGTALVSPAITWFGDVHAKKVKKEVSSMAGLIKEDIPLGYEYFAGMQLVVCHGPIDAMLDIFIGEKRVARLAKYVGEGVAQEPQEWPEPSNPTLPEYYPADGEPTLVSINLPKLFGGVEEGGGIEGQFDLHWGSETQGPNEYLSVWWGPDILPNYRFLCYVVLRRMNLGKSPNPSPWNFVIRRIPKVLGQDDYSEITDDDGNIVANGAEVIYEIITDPIWGLGKDPSVVDIAAFQEVAQTLYDEGMGFSGILASKSEAWDAIKRVQEHIDGVVFQHPTTGLISIKLIRDDYTLANLVHLTESNCIIEEYTRGSWAETSNETQAKYTDIARRFSDAVAQAQNLAAIQAMDGEIISTTIDRTGFGTHELAQAAAEKSNRVTSVPLMRVRLSVHRDAYLFHPGYPFKLSYTEYDLDEAVFRVTSVNYGSLVDGKIVVDAVQDSWDLTGVAYASPDDLTDLSPCGPLSLLLPGYDPADDPSAYFGEGNTKFFEAPYWHSPLGAAYAWMAQGKAKNNDLYWECWVSVHGAERTIIGEPGTFVPVGVLDGELAKTGVILRDVTIQVINFGDVETLTSTTFAGMLSGERLLMIDDEICSWEEIIDLGDGRFRIRGLWRGQLDTVPEIHYDGARVFFYYNGASDAESAREVTGYALDADTLVSVWPVITAFDGTVWPIDRVPPSSLVISERAAAPYPPGNIKINGYSYEDWPATTSGDVTLSWANRSRTGQTQMLAQDDNANYTMEGTLTITVLLDGLAVREWTGVTGNSQVYTWAQRQADDSDLTKKVEFEITPIGTSSEEGTMRTTPSFIMGS